jgi:hypothetical protein
MKSQITGMLKLLVPASPYQYQQRNKLAVILHIAMHITMRAAYAFVAMLLLLQSMGRVLKSAPLLIRRGENRKKVT